MADAAVPRWARASAGSGVVEGKAVQMGLRCSGCGERLADYAAPPYRFYCRKCKVSVGHRPIDAAATGGVE